MERESDKETIQFMGYVTVSCAELRTQIYSGIEIEYINKEFGLRCIQKTKELSSMIMGMIKHLKT